MHAYWNHNVAYHKWILKQIKSGTRVLDVGCGDGFLIEKLAKVADTVIGIEPHEESAQIAKQRLKEQKNTVIFNGDFDSFSDQKPFDTVIFVASVHHMPLEQSLMKAKRLLKSNGKLLIVGCSKPVGVTDLLVECARVLPAKIGSILHGERNGGNIGVPTQIPEMSLQEIRRVAGQLLAGVRIHRALYYRYLLMWEKP